MAAVENKSAEDKVFNLINYILLTILTFIFLYPIWFVLVASFSDPAKLMTHVGTMLIPQGFSLDGYKAVLNNKNIMTGYGNTIFYVVAGTSISMVLTTLGAYVLSRRNLYLKKFMMPMIVFTMYIHAGIIPDFLLVKYIGLYNTHWAILLPTAIVTWNLVVMRTSFMQIPQSLEESAKIDGANDFTILYRIILPVAKSTIAVIVLFYAVGMWNSWFNAMIYLRDRSKYPLQLFLREILIANSTTGNNGDTSPGEGVFLMDELIKYCTIIVSTVPILCIYPMAQRYFITGVMMGSLKE